MALSNAETEGTEGLPDVTLRIEATPAESDESVEWLRGRLLYGPSVASWIPDGFESCARILHPAHQWEESNGSVVVKTVSWKDVGAWSGKPLHRASSIQDLGMRSDGTPWSGPGASLPLEGQLEPPCLDRLADALANVTSTPATLWFLVWNGYQGAGTVLLAAEGGDRSVKAIRRRSLRASRSRLAEADLASKVEISTSLTASGRTYVLQRGSLDPASNDRRADPLDRPPSFWWADDLSWFICTDIDSSSTYVAGSPRLIDQLLGDDLLEVFLASRDDPFDGVSSASERGAS